MNNVNVFKLLKFPLQLSATATLHNLGTIVTNRDGFHSERYIYPAGYMASKISAALDNPDEKVRWFTEIIDNGGDAPVFKIWIEGKEEEAFEGNTPTSPFAKAFRSPNSVRKVASISGPDAFSLTNPIVIYLLQLSPQAKDLKRYVFHDLDNNPNVIMFLDSLLDNEVEVEEEV
ncbi:F/Y-rich N-terminus family protein [Histomonas meleagridis]|uniref:F/Y-rich N-terminus family protein n=1 Tax=Histomonas meleagridis TaxID=135588 RepID=UPI00355A195A|nr:F/Y-rich N-terminus family protein [Histomonas meleagridis]KAH0800489.1 F/Y-rich N-terminus family protein [Histomonas meleagridis]